MISTPISRICERLAAILTSRPNVQLSLLADAEMPLTLRFCHKNDVIDDHECNVLFEALETAIYRRYIRIADDAKSFIWMRLCHSDELEAVLTPMIMKLNHLERESILLDSAFQKMQRDDQDAKDKPRSDYQQSNTSSMRS